MKISPIYVFVCLLLPESTLSHCSNGFVMSIENNEVKCLPCPSNCNFCYLDI